MKAMTRLLAALAVVTLLAAGCGDSDDDDAASNGDSGTAVTADLEGETIEVAAVWSGTEQERFEAVLDQFEEDTGATVTFTSTGDDISATLGPRISANDPPDVAMLPQPGLLRDFAGQGVLQPIEDVAGETIDENYDEIWRELGSVDGELYGVWFKAANKSTVWYNAPVFEDAGVEPTEDWDAFLESAQTLADFGVTPMSIGAADGWVLTDWFENVYLRTAGPELYDQLANHEIPWTDQSVKDALAVLAELFGETDLIVGGPEGALQTEFPQSVAQTFTDPPDGAMVYEGDFVAGVITGDTEAELGTDADFFPFPAVDGSEPSIVGGGDVAVLMTDTEAGKALIEYLATPEAAAVWAAEGGFISPNENLDLETYPDEISQNLASEVVDTEVFRFDMSDLAPAAFGGTPGQGSWALLQDFLRDPGNVDAITEQLEAAATQAYG
jgi:alpha-glucoside transport system substrate-binding protein